MIFADQKAYMDGDVIEIGFTNAPISDFDKTKHLVIIDRNKVIRFLEFV